MDKTPCSGNIVMAPAECFGRIPLEASTKAKPAAAPHQGLCSTCNNAPECSYIAGREKRPVICCEEFDGSAPPIPAPLAACFADPPGCRPVKLMGLCVNCAQLEVCRFPKPEGGIWHCEEYE